MGSGPRGLTPSSRHALWAVVLALAGFVALAIGYGHEPLETLDAETAEALADGPGWLEAPARLFSWLGNGPVLTALAVAAGIALVWVRRWPDFVFLVFAIAGSSFAVGFLKEWFDRPRPDAGSVIPLPASAAFPSGHAAAGIAGLGALTILAAERVPDRRARIAVYSGAAVIGLLVGLSRIALNVHYVTDVVAGWFFGLAWLAVCLLLRDVLARGRP